jgi:hypothetical protein
MTIPAGAPRELFAVVDTHFPDESPMVTHAPKEARDMLGEGPGLVLVRYIPEADYLRVCLHTAEQEKQTTAALKAATETINDLRTARDAYVAAKVKEHADALLDTGTVRAWPRVYRDAYADALSDLCSTFWPEASPPAATETPT